MFQNPDNTMRPFGMLLVSAVLFAVVGQTQVRADSGSFGDSGLYKIVIEKTRVPALEDGISPSDTNEDHRGASVIMHNRKGQPFRCSIPQMVKVPDEKDKLVNLTTKSIEEALVPTESNRGCVNLVTSGWWHYEFCFRKHVTQYHMDAGGTISKPVIILGLFSSAFDWSNVSAKDALRKKDRYHLQYFINGTECDITGQQRQTRVKIYCDNSHWTTDHIESVREPESCVYEVVIFSKRLCSISYFKKEEPSVSQISCNPVSSQLEIPPKKPENSLSLLQNEPKNGNLWMENFMAKPEDNGYQADDESESEPEKTSANEEKLPQTKKNLDTKMDEDDDARLFYKKAQRLAAARKEKWIPEEVLNKAYSIVLEDERNPFVRPSNREFIVMELVRRTAHLLIHKAKLNSAEQRSLAFDQAAQNVADAMRIISQKNYLSEAFIARYTPIVVSLQQYTEQFLSLYDLQTMAVMSDLAEEEELNMEFQEELRKHTGETLDSPTIPVNQAQVSSMMKKIDILSLKPFSDEEREVFDALVDSGKAIILISKTFDDKDDESNEAAIRDAENELLAIKETLNNPKSRTWRPEFRDKMNQILSLKLAMLTDLHASMADTPYDSSEESDQLNFVDIKSESVSRDFLETLPSNIAHDAFKEDFLEMEKFYLTEGYNPSSSVLPQQTENSASNLKMSSDEMEAAKKILFSHTTAIRLIQKDNKEDNLLRSRILWDRAVFILSDEKRNIRTELKTKMRLHLGRIAKYLKAWEHDQNMELVKASLNDDGSLNSEEKKATLETFSSENEELTADEKDVVIALFKSYSFTNNMTPGKGDPVLRTEAYKNARLLAERARWLLRDESKKIRLPFRQKMSARVEKLADHLERLEKADEKLQKLRTQLTKVTQVNSELTLANKMLRNENLDLDNWVKRFSGTIEKARESVRKDLKLAAPPVPVRPLSPEARKTSSTDSTLIPAPKSKALQFRDVIANMDPRQRRLKEIEELLREKFSSFGGGGLEIKLVNPAQEGFAGLGDRQLQLIKRDLAGVFAAQMLGVNNQQRVVDELEENYNLQEDDQEDAGLSEREKIINRMLDL